MRFRIPLETYDDWNDRLPNMPEGPIEIVLTGVFSFLSNYCLNARAHSQYHFTMFARELMI